MFKDAAYGWETTERQAAAAAAPRLEAGTVAPGAIPAAEARSGADASSAPEAPTKNLSLKIEQAKQQGRSKFEEGLRAVKNKIDKFFQRINALPKEIMGIAKEAVAESFAVGARAEVALDALNRKIDAAQEVMDKKIDAAKKEIAARKQEAERRALAAIDRVINSTSKFFGEIGGSLFAGSRRQETEDLGRSILDFIADYTKNEGKTPPAELLQTVVNKVLEIQKQHRENADLIGRFANSIFRTRLKFVPV